MAGRQGNQTVKNMLWSLVVITLVAGVIYIFVPHDESKTPVKRVDYRVELLTARRAAAYPVAAPEGLSKAWKPTSVRFNGAEHDDWHLGFLDPDGEYVAVKQSTAKPAKFIEDATQEATRTDATEKIGGRTWQRYKGSTYDALVSTEKGATTVVTGTAPFRQLAKMAESLEMKKA
ncbi:DUF4245 domain-containing protein [Streptomyces sp. WAC 01529]|uniref:DUF4245 domain-containing protein n=1 Tax=Streptomyces sp. WAC 01529 TaxID=2203205 RepID=UPI000F70B117|nr:DUF4245 domain-containing protein [Streptomyces sp. WAC 01529]AZM55211.1 DUF4245 domain-containing protein [Streptomyces sp. WAC 01529]